MMITLQMIDTYNVIEKMMLFIIHTRMNDYRL